MQQFDYSKAVLHKTMGDVKMSPPPLCYTACGGNTTKHAHQGVLASCLSPF